MAGTRKTSAQKKSEAAPVPVTVLEKFKLSNPHAGGWDKAAAIEAAREFAALVNEGMTPQQVWLLMNVYKDFAGWNNCNRAVAEKYGLAKLKGE